MIFRYLKMLDLAFWMIFTTGFGRIYYFSQASGKQIPEYVGEYDMQRRFNDIMCMVWWRCS